VRVWSIDAEYGFRGGADRCPSAFVPVVFCAVCADTGERRHFWGRDRGLSRFVRDHVGDLFVSHNLVAEAQYLLRLGIDLPAAWWDTMLGWRFATNAEVVPRFGLLDALAGLGLPHDFANEKEGLRARIGTLTFNAADPAELRTIRDYCYADCQAALGIYRKLSGRVPPNWMACAAEYALAVAALDLRGIPLDRRRYARLMERRQEVVAAVTAAPNRVCEVFIDGQLSRQRFLGWCARNGVGWPSARSPRTGLKSPSLDRRAFERMKDCHPFVAQVHEANKTAKQLLGRSLAVDPVTGRHHFGSIPYATATGRTSCKAFLLSGPKWMRFFIVPPSPDHLVVSVDFDAQEIGVAAYLSGDRGMLEGYTGGDPHMDFAIRAGAAPPGATKATHGAVRKKFKTVNLAVNYGQTAYGLAQSAGLRYEEAATLLEQHHRAYATFWSWLDRYTVNANRRGVAHTAGGWPRKVSRRDNCRSVANYPIQGTGGDLLRLATVALCRQGLRLLATNHDGFLFECRRSELPRLREAVDASLRQAVNLVLPGAPLRWTYETFSDRYRDPDGAPLWGLVNDLLSAKRTRTKTEGKSVFIGTKSDPVR
jgi:hypothetical protein